MTHKLAFLILLISYFFVSNDTTLKKTVNQQKQECCTLFTRNAPYTNSCLFDYLNSIFPNKTKYLSFEPNDSHLPVLLCNDTTFIAKGEFGGSTFEIKIKKENTSFYITKEIIETNTLYNDLNLRPLKTPTPSSTSKIAEFSVLIDSQLLSIPDSLYANLYAPNFCNTFYPMRPISSSFSTDGKFLYLYLYGDSGIYLEEMTYKMPMNYIAKFVFSKDSFETRLLLDYSILKYCNFTCPNFIGF